ncbi:hypothetical protein [Streptomyces fuscigenes]|uniref:hypothetical protein n=1 Tax=Streptomyces fuscigenes TaxID=1528880 RepID=UPI001F3D6DFB|nr:hypothetical protein [Streptomyces fuscigenes]MCF3962011.1 hypothetical protein [Streptomyces fuscigenes]
MPAAHWPGARYPWAPPRPGTIPLAPLDFWQVLGGGLATFGRFWSRLVAVALTAFGAALVLGAIAVGATAAVFAARIEATADRLRDGGGDLWAAAGAPAVVSFALLGVLGLLALAAAQSLVLAACTAAVQEGVLGRPLGYRDLLGRALRGARRSFVVHLLAGLPALLPIAVLALAALALGGFSPSGRPGALALVLGWLLALACVPVVLWLGVQLSLAPVAAVAESARPLQALRRSRRLVRGAWWRTFGLVAVAGMIAGAAAAAVNLVLELVGWIALLGAFAVSHHGEPLAPVAIVLFPVVLLALAFLVELLVLLYPQLVLAMAYVDRRMRAEGLAGELIRAL